MNKLKKAYLKIFLVLSLSLTVFILVGAMSVTATEPTEEVGDEVEDLVVAVTPGGGDGHQYQYQGDNGDGYAHTHTHHTNGDSDHNQYYWQHECKK